MRRRIVIHTSRGEARKKLKGLIGFFNDVAAQGKDRLHTGAVKAGLFVLDKAAQTDLFQDVTGQLRRDIKDPSRSLTVKRNKHGVRADLWPGNWKGVLIHEGTRKFAIAEPGEKPSSPTDPRFIFPRQAKALRIHFRKEGEVIFRPYVRKVPRAPRPFLAEALRNNARKVSDIFADHLRSMISRSFRRG